MVLRPAALSVEATAELVERRLDTTPRRIVHRRVPPHHRRGTRCCSASSFERLPLTESAPMQPTPTGLWRSVLGRSRAWCSCASAASPRTSWKSREPRRCWGTGVVAAGGGGARRTPRSPHRRGASATLARAQIVSDQHPLVFLHPLVREAVYDGAPGRRARPAARAGSSRARALRAERRTCGRASAAGSTRAGDEEVVGLLRDCLKRRQSSAAPRRAPSPICVGHSPSRRTDPRDPTYSCGWACWRRLSTGRRASSTSCRPTTRTRTPSSAPRSRLLPHRPRSSPVRPAWRPRSPVTPSRSCPRT